MTMHAAKGLEFSVVFLPGWEEGLFPSKRSVEESDNGLEEERRLAYVAITRAKKNLFLSYANSRQVFGDWQYNLPSRFISEIEGLESVEHPKAEITDSQFNSHYKRNDFPKKTNPWQSNLNAIKIDSNSDEEDNRDFRIGDRVRHQNFGIGTVTTVNDSQLGIYFKSCGAKTIIKTFIEKI